MAINYSVRKVCEAELAGNTEEGAGKGWHYFRTIQVDSVNSDIACPDHAESATRDFVVEKEETV